MTVIIGWSEERGCWLAAWFEGGLEAIASGEGGSAAEALRSLAAFMELVQSVEVV